MQSSSFKGAAQIACRARSDGNLEVNTLTSLRSPKNEVKRS